MEKIVYECEVCRELSSKTWVFDGNIVKKVLNAPQLNPISLKTEVCSIECLVKKIKRAMGSAFEEKPIVKKPMNGKSLNEKKEEEK